MKKDLLSIKPDQKEIDKILEEYVLKGEGIYRNQEFFGLTVDVLVYPVGQYLGVAFLQHC